MAEKINEKASLDSTHKRQISVKIAVKVTTYSENYIRFFLFIMLLIDRGFVKFQ